MSNIAEPFKALGAGNGFTFCREKAFSAAESSKKPISVLTLKESMAWYWLLKDFELMVEMTSSSPENPSNYNGTVTVKFEDFFSETFAGSGASNPLHFMSKPPKDRAILTAAARASGFDESQLDSFALGNNGQEGFTTTGNLNDGNYHYEVDFTITWYDDDTCIIVFYITANYHKFILTNLPTTAPAISGVTATPVSLGTVSTAYGDLYGYDLTNDTTYENLEIQYTCDSFTFSSEFYTFD